MEFYCCMHVLLLHFRIVAIIHVINPKWQLVLPLCRTTTTTIHLPAHLPPGNDRDRSCKKPRIEIIDGGDDGKLGAVYVEVEEGSLNGLAMFVGGNSHSFALPASEFPGLKPNSIYFTDAKEILPPESSQVMGYGGNDVGIFDYEKKEFYPCHYPLHVDDITSLTPVPIWFTPASSLISKI
ncbi:hypothetical protein C2S53_011524 [Perilla frutescens var. hirtella]|uniref:KIB1-4 beta-propeller domain-containing protein n=1 Tax=Perilla frutescens var. hirtella TaxID=608512 RepID=A0AAD4P7Z2_PERFH|nr:hypothetical protein C2S53_011524 [Perilla frutescens var. hirtella]